MAKRVAPAVDWDQPIVVETTRTKTQPTRTFEVWYVGRLLGTMSGGRRDWEFMITPADAPAERAFMSRVRAVPWLVARYAPDRLDYKVMRVIPHAELNEAAKVACVGEGQDPSDVFYDHWYWAGFAEARAFSRRNWPNPLDGHEELCKRYPTWKTGFIAGWGT